MKRVHVKGSLFTWLSAPWKYRRLALTLARRDIRIQYAQTFLGMFTSMLQPLISVLIFWLFFSRLIHIDTGQIHYALFVLSGLTGWYLFSYIVSSCGTALMESQHLIKKVNFPRLILPLSKVITGLIHFGISLFLLLGLMLILRHPFPLSLLAFPLFLILNILTGLSVALWLSALTIRYRDVQHIIPYLLSFGIWLTPVFYPGSIIPSDYFHLMYFNPMAGVIAGYRWALLGDIFPDPGYLFGLIPVFILLVTGLIYFRKTEHKIPDFI